MKKTITTVALLLTTIALMSCYNRIGKMTVISTRNMDSDGAKYFLLSKDVRAKAKTKKHEALEAAVDKAVHQFPTGEFMKNCVVEVSSSGKKIRVTGDVWGYEVKK